MGLERGTGIRPRSKVQGRSLWWGFGGVPQASLFLAAAAGESKQADMIEIESENFAASSLYLNG